MNFGVTGKKTVLAATASLPLLGAAGVETVHGQTLHRPLPARSLAVNALPQTLKAHRKPSSAAPSPTETPVSPNAQAALRRVYSGTPIDTLTYHNDGLRTGWNQSEQDLTPATVASGTFVKIAKLVVDGNVLAQPLTVANYLMPDKTVHNVLIVATGHNSVYAYDAQTYTVLWQVNLGTPQATGDVGCGDVQPEYGISSTPVIVRNAAGRAAIYVVAATEPAPFSFHTQLHALDLGTGADIHPAVEIAPTATLSDGSTIAFDPQNQWSRAGLAYANNSVYVSIGSHCDNNAGGISGWEIRYSPALALRSAFNTIEAPASYELASIWMTGFAPAIDDVGNLFVVTGNGNYSLKAGQRGYGESVLSLNSSLHKVNSSFTPFDFKGLNDADNDFGSGGVMLLPPAGGQTAPTGAVAIGKDAVLYLLNPASLGGRKLNDAGALGAIRVGGSGGGTWGGPAYYGGPDGGIVYAQISNDVLHGYSVTTSPGLALTEIAQGTTNATYGGSLPVVSSAGITRGTGLVWLVRRTNPVQLEAYDALSLGAPVFTGVGGTWSTGENNAFVTPLVANGRAYLPAYKSVTVFGLTP